MRGQTTRRRRIVEPLAGAMSAPYVSVVARIRYRPPSAPPTTVAEEFARAIAELRAQVGAIARRRTGGASDEVFPLTRMLDENLERLLTRFVAGPAAALLESDERLRTAVEASDLGVWEWIDPPRGPRRWSRRCKEWFGFRSDEDISPERFLAALHPDDRDRWNAHMRSVLRGDTQYRVEYRVIGASDGTERWIAATGRMTRDADGRARMLGTMQDITERRHAEQDRELFLGMLAHDLRNPLGAIQLSADLLSRRPEPPVVVGAKRIATSAEKMTRLVEEVLEFARVRSGHLELHRTVVDLGALCRDVIDEVQAAHPGHAVELEYPARVSGEWDEGRLQEVVANLVANAIAHGLPGAPVLVAVRGDEGSAVLDVRNQGKPIPEDLRAHMFDPYRRGTTGGHGVGLGLYITQAIVVAHGGEISVSSDARETRFSVTLPRSAIATH
jgi:PAS domain S-box-containing protein